MEKEEHNSHPNFTKRLIFLSAPVFLVVLIWFGGLIKERIFIPKPVHIHAGFIVVKNNQIEDFSDWRFMSVKPCADGEAHKNNLSKEEIQHEKAHLHEQVGDVVHSHREGATWEDLFINLEYPIDYKNTKAFINGNPVDDFKDNKITNEDSLVVFVDEENDQNQFLQKQVTKEKIQEIVKQSEDCGA